MTRWGRGLRASVVLATALPLLTTPLRAADAPDPLQGASKAINAPDYLRHVQTLSSDEFEGRAPGTRGETQTVGYLKKQFADLGLQSGNPDGSYTQVVPMTGYTADTQASFTVRDAIFPLRCPEDIVAFAMGRWRREIGRAHV